MIKVNAYASYDGGKGGSGTYQTLINLIPPFKTFLSLYAGNCGVARHINLGNAALLINDLDPAVTEAWWQALKGSGLVYNVVHTDALAFMDSPPFISIANNDGFIFLDPPYPVELRKVKSPLYKYEMMEWESHGKLLSRISKMPYKIMICTYPNSYYDFALTDWHYVDYYSKTRNGLALERVYMNYTITDGKLHDYSFIGDDFTERQALKRQKHNVIDKLNDLPPVQRNAILAEIYKQFPL